MKILLVGIGKENLNYRKIEGFYNAFSKFSSVEWVQNIFDRKSNSYDVVFGEIDIDEIFYRLDEYKNIEIKKHVFWNIIDLKKLTRLSNERKDVSFICAYKSDVLNKRVLIDYRNLYGNKYQYCSYEGINIEDFINLGQGTIDNLKIIYLPPSLSEKEEFIEEKDYDVCYFGTLGNRPRVDEELKRISKNYKVINTAWDRGLELSPNECYDLYKKTKATISEQIEFNVLEYPVRLGESTSTGCRLFLLEKIPIKSSNFFIPEYSSFQDMESLSKGLEFYLENFSIEESRNLYKGFESTYDNAVKYILDQ